MLVVVRVTPAHGRAELEARYGKLLIDADPRGGMRIISPIGWEAKWMTLMRDLPGCGDKRLYVNRDMAEPLRAALSAVAVVAPEYKIRTIGCWNVRYKRTSAKQVSLHALGLAVDINADRNPMRSPIETDMPPLFVDAFMREGFTWGGDFGMPDPMHFQLCSGF